MYVAKKITIDLNRPRKEVVHLGQGDSFTRWIELTLLCDGIPYDPTADLDALGIQDGSDSDIIKTVKYIKANGISGEYEKIPEDGTTPAVALMDGETNIYIVRLDEHATDVPGFAEIFVTFYAQDGDGVVHTLHSFAITLDVIRTGTSATDPGSPYYNVQSFYIKPPGGIPASDLAPDAKGLSNEAKQALLACFAHVAWTDEHGQDYYDALEAALYPDVTLLSITADYQQDHPIYDTDSLDAIKVSDDLTVTANYSNGTSVVLDDDDYELSGTLTVGTNTVTVTYEGKTASITVLVIARYLFSLENGMLIKYTGSTSGAVSGYEHDILADMANTKRRSFPMQNGVRPYLNMSTHEELPYYPIPVPPDAIKAKISITPATQYHGESMYTYDSSVGYTRQADPGWKQGSFTHTFTAGAYDYITVASKYDSAGTSYPTEPTALVVEFLTE